MCWGNPRLGLFLQTTNLSGVGNESALNWIEILKKKKKKKKI